MLDLTLVDIEAAHARIREKLAPTHLVTLDLPGLDRRIIVKPEYLQPTGSFKFRGATNCIASLTEDQKRRGVIAYSTGNHAQAVALAAKVADVRSTIVMSPDVPVYKVDHTRELGARVLMAEPSSEARRRLAEECARNDGMILIPPYDDLAVMAGQGTIGLEILEETIPSIVYVPIGGGGLIAGIAAAIKQREHSVRVIGVEPVEENDAYRSRAAGTRIRLSGPSASIADAIKVQIPGEKTFSLMQRYVDDIVLIDDRQIIEAMRLYFRQTGHRLERAGAVALAAALQVQGGPYAADVVVSIATGQNVTYDGFAKLTGLM
jgi:threonine dehydratase